MAPEVVGRKGYTWCVDWWSFGITIYELLFLRRPFDGRTSEKMTNSILKDSLTFPDDASKKCSANCMKFVQSVSADTLSQRSYLFSVLQLLERNVSQRIGCRPNGQGFEDIKNNPWLLGVDWDSMESKETQPPFVPDVSVVICQFRVVFIPCR